MSANISLLRRAVTSGAAILCLTATALATTNDFSIGINFAHDQLLEDYASTASPSSLDAEELAGVPGGTAGLPPGQQKNWNNATDSLSGLIFGGNFATPLTMVDIVADDKGVSTPTTASVTWRAPGTWSTSGSRGAAETNGWRFMTNSPPDHKLLTGYLDMNAANQQALVIISNVPPELTGKGYHVYVYMNGGSRTAGRGGSIRLVDTDSGVALTPWLQWTTLVDPQTHTRDLGVNHTDTGTFVLFTNLANLNLTVEANNGVNPGTGTPRVPIAAVQLINANLSEPIVGAATANGQFSYLSITDLASAQVDTATVQLTLDGDATPIPVQVNKSGILTTITYDNLAHKGAFFVSGSNHTNILTFKDTTGRTFTATRTFTVSAFTTVNAAFAQPTADTTKPGFRSRVYQTEVPRGPASYSLNTGVNAAPEAERQLAAGYIDPFSDPKAPYANTADLSAVQPDGFFHIEGVVNWEQTGAAAGSISANSTPPVQDELIPGIAGAATNPTDNFVTEILTYLEFQPGLYRLGVFSDDGFQFSVSRTPGDLRGQIVATRASGSADMTFDIAITQAGFYPVRLLWWEGNGGAHIELYSQDLVTGARTLVNDASSSIKAYRESAVTYPWVSKILPAPDQSRVVPDVDFVVELTDGSVFVDAETATLTLNGVAVPANKIGAVTYFERAGSLAELLPGGANTVVLSYAFTSGGSSITVSHTWTFTVGGTTGGAFGPAIVTIPPGNRVPAGSVDTATQGFKVLRVHQIDRTGDASQGNGGRHAGQGGDGNQMPRPEIQLNEGYRRLSDNELYPNLADLSFANPDGSFDLFGTPNWNILNTLNTGAFNGGNYIDSRAPGVPGTGSSQGGQDNLVFEIATYLDLKAGVYLMSVNSDDGFVLTSAPDVHDTLGTLVGMWNVGGGSANPPSRFICFVVVEDGIYPFRLLWWQGGGGGNIEWSSIDYESGRSVLLNDLDVPFSVKSYNTYTGPARPWVKFAVYPLPSAYQNPYQQSGPGPITVRVAGANPVDAFNDSQTIRAFADGFGALMANVGSETVTGLLNGNPVPVTTTAAGADTLVQYKPAVPLASGSTATAGLVYGGVSNFWTFIVQTYASVPAGVAKAPSATAPRGFLARVAQSVGARPGGNTAAAAEAQLAGTPANVALPGPNPGGSYTIPGIINMNTSKIPGATPSDTGNFTPTRTGQADDAFPGLPGTGLTGAARFENFSIEFFAFLELPAGYQKFGVNGDDGWAVKIGMPGDATGQVLFTTDRGAGNRDIPFSFYVPEAGLYPVRLVFYQGGGGGNLEFYTYGANNRKIPVNADDPEAVKAYQTAQTNPTLSIAHNSDGSVTITFEGQLQSTTSLSPINWQPVAGATSPRTVTPAEAELYFRAVSP